MLKERMSHSQLIPTKLKGTSKRERDLMKRVIDYLPE
jgi:hypothetical protein